MKWWRRRNFKEWDDGGKEIVPNFPPTALFPAPLFLPQPAKLFATWLWSSADVFKPHQYNSKYDDNLQVPYEDADDDYNDLALIICWCVQTSTMMTMVMMMMMSRAYHIAGTIFQVVNDRRKLAKLSSPTSYCFLRFAAVCDRGLSFFIWLFCNCVPRLHIVSHTLPSMIWSHSLWVCNFEHWNGVRQLCCFLAQTKCNHIILLLALHCRLLSRQCNDLATYCIVLH